MLQTAGGAGRTAAPRADASAGFPRLHGGCTAGMTGDLFSPATLKRLCSGIEPTGGERAAADKWLALLEAGDLADEQCNYPRFTRVVLEGILGYGDDMESEGGRGGLRYVQGSKALACFEVGGRLRRISLRRSAAPGESDTRPSSGCGTAWAIRGPSTACAPTIGTLC